MWEFEFLSLFLRRKRSATCRNPARAAEDRRGSQSGTRTSPARAPSHAVCGRFVHCGRARRQEASSVRCKTVVRRASCFLFAQMAFGRHARRHAAALALSLGRGRSTRARRARSPCHAGCSRPMRDERALHRQEASLRLHKTVARRASYGLLFAQPAFGSRARALHCARSLLGGRRSTRAFRARATCRAGYGRSVHYRKALHRRDHGATCQLRPPQCVAGFRVACAGAPLRSLSLGRRSTRACCARAPRRAGCGRSVKLIRPLHQREASLLRCETVVRYASCGLLLFCAAGFRMVRAGTPLRSMSLGRTRSTRACLARATCRAGCSRFIFYTRALHRQKGLSSSVQDRAATRQLRPPLCASGFHVTRAGAPVRSLSVGRRHSTRACRARARRHAGCWLRSDHVP